MGRWLWGAIALSLAANAALGVLTYLGYGELTQTKADLAELQLAGEDIASEAHSELATVREDLRSAEVRLVRLEGSSPDARLDKLETRISNLRFDLNFVEDTNDIILNYIGSGGSSGSSGIAASQIQKPYLCFRGDYAIWDFNGLSC